MPLSFCLVTNSSLPRVKEIEFFFFTTKHPSQTYSDSALNDDDVLMSLTCRKFFYSLPSGSSCIKLSYELNGSSVSDSTLHHADVAAIYDSNNLPDYYHFGKL